MRYQARCYSPTNEVLAVEDAPSHSDAWAAIRRRHSTSDELRSATHWMGCFDLRGQHLVCHKITGGV